jgi:TP53 regulating kinase-like protein
MERGPLLSQCAESIVYECNFYGFPAIQKVRFPKQYRIEVLDKKLREQRTCREARALVRCRKLGVTAPTVYAVDRAECSIVMQRIVGVTARHFIETCRDPVKGLNLLAVIGEAVGRLHEGDIIHGDLTTSNFMVNPSVGLSQVVVIDFGLVRDSTSAEERAVDLYVLERAVNSSHPELGTAEEVQQAIWRGYQLGISSIKGEQTNNRLQAVRARGRKRSMIG